LFLVGGGGGGGEEEEFGTGAAAGSKFRPNQKARECQILGSPQGIRYPSIKDIVYRIL